MKKTLILITFVINCISNYSLSQQVSFTCTSRQICEYNDIKKTFDNCVEISESSSFTVNEDETVISHVSLKFQNVFYVNEKSFDEENGVHMYDTYDENGKWYVIHFDIEKKEIRLMDLSFPPVDKPYTKYLIKAIF